jgi:hypothetical protein
MTQSNVHAYGAVRSASSGTLSGSNSWGFLEVAEEASDQNGEDSQEQLSALITPPRSPHDPYEIELYCTCA